jgi:hypothetical protein
VNKKNNKGRWKKFFVRESLVPNKLILSKMVMVDNSRDQDDKKRQAKKQKKEVKETRAYFKLDLPLWFSSQCRVNCRLDRDSIKILSRK